MIEGAFLHVLDGMSFLRPFARAEGRSYILVVESVYRCIHRAPAARGAPGAGCPGESIEEIERPWRAAARRAIA